MQQPPTGHGDGWDDVTQPSRPLTGHETAPTPPLPESDTPAYDQRDEPPSQPYQPYGTQPPYQAPAYGTPPTGPMGYPEQSSYTPYPPYTMPFGASSYAPPPPSPPYGAAPYPTPGYAQPYPPVPYMMRPARPSGAAIAVEAVLSFFGIFGVGWLMSGKTTPGAIVMILGFVWDVVAVIGTIITFGVGVCAVVPLHLIFVAVTTIALANQPLDG